jgi:acetyl-CoA synthetase
MTSLVWQPDPSFVRTTNLHWLLQRLGVATYEEAHAWSVAHRDAFWDLVRGRLTIQPGNAVANCFGADPAAPAVVEQAAGELIRTTSFGTLDRLSNRVAHALIARGLRPGETVGIVMPMTSQLIAIYLGILKAGGVTVGIAESFMPPEISLRLEIAGVRRVFTQEAIRRGAKRLPLAARVREAGAAELLSWEDVADASDAPVLVPRQPSDRLTILFSSGTTGDPKAIPWTHETPLKCAMDAHFHHDVRPGDVLAWPTSLGWMMGPWLMFAATWNRAAMALYDGGPMEPEFGRFVQDAGVTLLGVVPSLVKQWRATKAVDACDWSRIRAFSSTGECSNADDMAWLMARGGHKPIIEYCGGTEVAGGYITGTMVQPARPATFTTPALGLDFVILDDEGHEADVGEAFLVPPSVGLSMELLNADHGAVYEADLPRPGLRRHGDQIERLADGSYRAHGRRDDTMKLGGIKVSSAEIERVMLRVSGVRESAAVAVPPPGGGPSRLVVYAVADKHADLLREMQAAIGEHLNPLFKLHDVVVIDAFPRTASGKVMRRRLRDDYAAREGAPA